MSKTKKHFENKWAENICPLDINRAPILKIVSSCSISFRTSLNLNEPGGSRVGSVRTEKFQHPKAINLNAKNSHLSKEILFFWEAHHHRRSPFIFKHARLNLITRLGYLVKMRFRFAWVFSYFRFPEDWMNTVKMYKLLLLYAYFARQVRFDFSFQRFPDPIRNKEKNIFFKLFFSQKYADPCNANR